MVKKKTTVRRGFFTSELYEAVKQTRSPAQKLVHPNKLPISMEPSFEETAMLKTFLTVSLAIAPLFAHA
ncbi:hypothetical protein LP419_27805 [Massilia sp. H-1]|nr:hypothetical protein LP419_27805 [Massilia sp. H-1]